ncbi:MAG: 2Fe-2S iron-sulfur cluster binding domain-containing protein [Hymenobacter sp.]
MPASRIRRESFVAAADARRGRRRARRRAGRRRRRPRDRARTVTIQYEGSEYKLVVPAKTTILDAALDQDIDLPLLVPGGRVHRLPRQVPQRQGAPRRARRACRTLR